MEKPASVAVDTFRRELTNVVNSSGLPPFLLEMVLKDLYLQVATLAQQQMQADKEQYEKQSEGVPEVGNV